VTAAVPVRRPRIEAEDDCVLPFAVEPLDVRGRVVRLGPALDELLANHGYPNPVARLVAEASALGLLLSSTLKFSGRVTLQTQTDGPVDMLAVDIAAPDRVRAYARFDEKRVAALPGAYDAGALTGNGHLAMTIERADDPNRYQGIVALTGGSLEEAAHQYFARSEQIPTRVRLAVAEEIRPGRASGWRAGGLLAQFLPREPVRARVADLDPGDAPQGTPRHEVAGDDAWLEAQALVETVEDHELVDPDLSSERLLYRLFNERGVKVFRSQPVVVRCRCSRERIAELLNTFDPAQRTGMVENGRVSVKCEFCGRSYGFDPKEIGVDPSSS
jgi:molecular chaperone Hsp33